MQNGINIKDYQNRLRAALFSRFAGCTLGAPVEGWTNKAMRDYAKAVGFEFPPRDYWPVHPEPFMPRYSEIFRNYTKPFIDHVPADDDIGYTLLSLFCLEEYGRDFTVEDVGKNWLKYITVACTAEDIALKNLKNGIPADKAAEINNPYSDWIGADIRCDGYGYVNPCDPAEAARMAKTDALISHRGDGVYGSMYFAAAIAAAFGCDEIKQALTIALDFIPSDCGMANAIRFAFDTAYLVHSPEDAIKFVDEKYSGMSTVHTLNNAVLTVYSLLCFGDRITDIISNCVAMAHDCDCTAATAASIAGACYGMKALDEHWYLPFKDKVASYFNGAKEYSINDILARFYAIAEKGGSIIK